jgi:hypothetical protein
MLKNLLFFSGVRSRFPPAKMPLWFIPALILAASGCLATQFVTEDSIPSSLSDSCLSALVADVACPRQVKGFGSGVYFKTGVLEEVCTTQCVAALQSWQDDALSTCDEELDTVEMDNSSQVPASFILILFAYHLNKGCIRDGEQWCHRFSYEMSQGNATSQGQ